MSTPAIQLRLNLALLAKDFHIVDQLLAEGALPNFVPGTTKELPAIHQAAVMVDVAEILRRLYAAGANVNLQTVDGFTPLMMAARWGRTENAAWLLECGADETIVNDDGESALDIAVCASGVEVADLLLKTRPALKGGPLLAAAKNAINRQPSVDMMLWLLEKSINPNLVNSDGDSWLMVVQTDDSRETLQAVEELVKAGADVNYQNRDGKTALHKSVESWASSAFMKLLIAGANLDLPDNQGWTVRTFIRKGHGTDEMKVSLRAWDASQKAERAIRGALEMKDVRPL